MGTAEILLKTGFLLRLKAHLLVGKWRRTKNPLVSRISHAMGKRPLRSLAPLRSAAFRSASFDREKVPARPAPSDRNGKKKVTRSLAPLRV